MAFPFFNATTVPASEIARLARLNHEDAPIYQFRRKLMSRSVTISLGETSLQWNDGINKGEVSFSDIVAVRLRYEPGHLFLARFWLDIEPLKARPVRFANWGWRGLGEIETQNEAFLGFVGALHQRLERHGDRITFVAGERPWRQWLALTVGGISVVGLLVLMVRAASVGGFGTLAILAACLAFFGWQTWLMAARNHPGRYRPEALPQRLLPTASTHR